MNSRLNKLKKELSKNSFEYLLISNPKNIYYLTGFRGATECEREAYLLVDESKGILFTSKLYKNEVGKLLKDKRIYKSVITERGGFVQEFRNFIPKGSVVGVEANDLRLSEFAKLQKNNYFKLVKTASIVEKLRMIKGENEIKIIKKAVKITDDALMAMTNKFEIGISEKEIARQIRDKFEDAGADGLAFETIVASGENSALPHYLTSTKKVKSGVLLIDLGAKYKGYCGDLTRTYHIGKPTRKFVETYKLVGDVLRKSIENVKPGVTGDYLWKIAVDALGAKSKNFLHGLGHGVGLDIHEAPYIRKGQKTELKPGMVITIEPGLYYPKWGGVRIEEYVLVTDNGCKVLSQSPRILKEVIL
jgi:Xaa-Pro aminopeptidase